MSGFKRQACFNELSFEQSEHIRYDIDMFAKYVKTIKALKEKGFNGIRYAEGTMAETSDFGEMVFRLRSSSIGRQIFQFILSTARNPYIDPDTPAEARYVEEDFEVAVDETWKEGEGFTAAFLSDTITISLCSNERWHNHSYNLRKKGDYTTVGTVLNVSSPESTDSDLLDGFIAERTPVELKRCQTEPENKKWSFRKDHGTDKLKDLWARIKNCEYVIQAINSLPFNSKGRDFIEKCFENGIIHIRLIDSEKGYGMAIQTTGEDLKSTEEIGKILHEKYAP